MTSFPLPASSKRLPLPYIAALAGLAAVTSATLVLVVATTGTLVLTASEEWVMQTFPAACALAVIVAIVLGLPLHALLRVSGLTGRWVHVAATFIIATWVAALSFLFTPYSIPVHVDDHRGRILQAAHVYGLPAFMLLGILAGLARLWSWRVSLFVVAVAWFIPIAFAAMWYFRTPVGLYAIE